MDNGSERFFLLVGEPGWGKSSLCAWMIGVGREPDSPADASRRARLRDAWAAAYLCSATAGSTVNPTTFVRTIAAQLAHTFDEFAAKVLEREAPEYSVNVTTGDLSGRARAIGLMTDQINVEAADAREAWERSVRLPLADIAATQVRGDPIFIVVDGLDDALTFTPPNIVDLVAGSTDFPDRVRFFLTSRREERVLNAFPSSVGVRVVAVSMGVDPDNDEDIRAYIEMRASEPNIAAWAVRAGLEPRAFADELVARAAGNFLFIRFVLDNPPMGDAQAAFPNGLEAAYDEFLARALPGVRQYGADPTWTSTVKPVLGALTVASPAAPEEAIPRWLVPAPDVAQALTAVGQMTEWVDEDGGSRRLYHRSLADFLSTRAVALESRRAAEEPILRGATGVPRGHRRVLPGCSWNGVGRRLDQERWLWAPPARASPVRAPRDDTGSG